MGIQEILDINKEKNPVKTEPPTEVIIDTGNEIVSINGNSFIGKCRVTPETACEIRRMLEGLQRRRQKEKQYKEHIDRFVGNVSGKVYR